MSLLGLLDRTASVRLQTAPTVDSEGDAVGGLSAPVEYPCRLELTGRDAQQTDELQTWTVYLPASANVGRAASITIDGIRFDVTGTPYLVHGRTGPHHWQVKLTRQGFDA